MNVEIINNEKNRTVTRLSCPDKFLNWSLNSDDEYFIVIQSEFNENFNIDRSVTEALRSLNEFNPSQEIKVSNEVSAYLLKKSGGLLTFRCKKRPARYSVFVCDFNKPDQLKIYVDSDNLQFIDIADNLQFTMEDIQVETKKKSIFGFVKKETARPCVKIKLDGEMPVGYRSGSLYYTFTEYKYKYPITETMLSKGFIVPLYNGKKPEIGSFSRGFSGKIVKSK